MSDQDDGIQPLAVPTPGRVGQATAIEQSRAASEVQAAVLVAQSVPRSLDRARAEMHVSTESMVFAEASFYRFPRGGKTITGATVIFAREMARCWGHIQYGIAELRRDDVAGQSEIRAYAWDQQANNRSERIFIVPHKRDRSDESGGIADLVSMRDINDNNVNQGGRAVREMILAVIAPQFIEEALDRCRGTIAAGGGKPLEERISGALKAFEAFDVTQADLETKLGATADKWTGFDLAQLRTVSRSLARREVTVEDEFPSRRVTLDELPPPAPAPPAESTDQPEVPAEPADAPEPEEDGRPTADELSDMVTSSKAKLVTVPKALAYLQKTWPELTDFERVQADSAAIDALIAWVDAGGRAEANGQ